MTPTSQRDPLSSSPMPLHHGQMYQMDLTQGQDNSFGRHNQGNENNFSNQQQYGGPPPAWGGAGSLTGTLPSHPNIQRSFLQQNQLISAGLNLKNQNSSSGHSPQNILQQLQTSTSQSDMLSAGIFSRPPLEGFHHLSGPIPPRPATDISGRIREPAPRILETMGMTHALPSFGHVEGLLNPCRMRPPGTEPIGLDNSHMTQVPFRGQPGQQDADKNGPQSKINHVTHPLFSTSPMNPHQYGMECRQSVSGSNGPGMSGGMRSVFGEGDTGPSRGPVLGWGPGQSESKNYPLSHPHPPTLANLLQQHNPVDMRLNLPGDQGAEQLNSGLARLSAGHAVHTSTMNPQSPPNVGSLGAVHMSMLPMPTSQPPRPAPHSQLARGQHFLQEVRILSNFGIISI